MDQIYESYRLKDLIYFALKGWRKIFVLALLGAILLGSIAIIRNQNVEQIDVADTEKKEEAIVLAEDEIKAINNRVISEDILLIKYNKRIEFLRSRIDQITERLSNSIYLSLDDVVQGTFNLAIQIKNVTNEEKIILEQRTLLLSQDYLRLIKGNSFFAQLEKENNSLIAGTNLRELIQIQLEADNNIRIQIVGPDMKTVCHLTEVAQKYIMQEIDQQLNYSYPHQISIEREKFNTFKDSSIVEKRLKMEAELEDSMNELEQLVSDYDLHLEKVVEIEAEELIEERMKESEENHEHNESVQENTSGRISIPLYVIGGLFVGIMVALLWNFYRGSTSDMLLHPNGFATKAGLLYINESFVPQIEGKKKDIKIGSKLDNWLERQYISSKLKKATSMADSIDYANIIVNGLVEAKNKDSQLEKEITNIAVLGSKDPTILAAYSALAEVGKQEKNQFGYVLIDSGFDTVAAIETLKSTDAVLALVQPRRTVIKELLRSLELARELNKPILGLMSVEQMI